MFTFVSFQCISFQFSNFYLFSTSFLPFFNLFSNLLRNYSPSFNQFSTCFLPRIVPWLPWLFSCTTIEILYCTTLLSAGSDPTASSPTSSRGRKFLGWVCAQILYGLQHSQASVSCAKFLCWASRNLFQAAWVRTPCQEYHWCNWPTNWLMSYRTK